MVEPESWVKLLIRIRERIKIVYVTIAFISVLVGFVIAVILAHITWVATCPGVGTFHSNSQNSYMGACPGVGTCPGHYGIKCDQEHMNTLQLQHYV